MRLLSIFLIVVGFLIFIGNLTGAYRTIPGLGVAICALGLLMLRFAHHSETLSAGVEEWH